MQLHIHNLIFRPAVNHDLPCRSCLACSLNNHALIRIHMKLIGINLMIGIKQLVILILKFLDPVCSAVGGILSKVDLEFLKLAARQQTFKAVSKFSVVIQRDILDQVLLGFIQPS